MVELDQMVLLLGSQMFALHLCVEGLITSLWSYWEVVESLRAETSERKLGY